MSFILDALRKSEHERQRQGGPGISDLKPAIVAARLPGWAIALAALLLVNIVVVLVLVLRGGASSQPARAPETTDAPETAAARQSAPAAAQPSPAPTSRVDQVPPPASEYALPPPVLAQAPPPYEPDTQTRRAEARPPVYEEQPDQAPDPQLAAARQSAALERDSQSTIDNLPSVNDAEVQGRVPEMHLDLHVYSSRSNDRFVFLNGRKYREGGATPEGTKVERITPDGVVLNHRGLRFLMPRQ